MTNPIPNQLDTRRGLNCTLAYSGDFGSVHTYQCRVDMYNYSFQMLAEESQARRNRAYYPHRITPTTFTINVICKGTFEYRHFMDWMKGYAEVALNYETGASQGPAKTMLVTLAGREWARIGVPMTGYVWGDRVGALVWNCPITFEAASDPLAINDQLLNSQISSWHNADTANPVDANELAYFYPSSENANGDSDTPFYQNGAEADAAAKAAQDTANAAVIPNITEWFKSSINGDTSDRGLNWGEIGDWNTVKPGATIWDKPTS